MTQLGEETFALPQLPSPPGEILYFKLWGSYSHNTALPTSDYDYLMMYISPTNEILSLHPPPQTVDGKSPDFEAHEALKFCQLLLKGNPGMVECLFTERDQLMTPPWRELRDQRDRFLSQRVVLQYLGYGQGQLKRFDVGRRLHTKGGRQNEKWLYHMIRVLLDARRIVIGQAPIVYKVGEEHDLLMDIRQGKIAPNIVIKMAKEIIKEIDATKPWKLPPLGDEEYLNTWLMNIRESH